MPLLSGVFLGNLQFDPLIRLLQAAEKWRDRFASLEINGAILDLDDNVVVKLSVKGMKDVVRCASAITLRVTPIQMMVVNESPIEKQSAVRAQRASDHIGCVGGRAAVG